jgi:hypothetical protein
MTGAPFVSVTERRPRNALIIGLLVTLAVLPFDLDYASADARVCGASGELSRSATSPRRRASFGSRNRSSLTILTSDPVRN